MCVCVCDVRSADLKIYFEDVAVVSFLLLCGGSSLSKKWLLGKGVFVVRTQFYWQAFVFLFLQEGAVKTSKSPLRGCLSSNCREEATQF